jgi:exopolyphosphatase/pppGpp-phosphohydrolase
MSRLALLECGSNSLKVHFRSALTGEYRALKLPWRLGRDVFETGSLSVETVEQAIRTVHDLERMGFARESLVAIATEGVRDARNRADVIAQLEERLGLKVRIVTGREEASLLAEGYLKEHGRIPAFLADIGGGSLQLVHISQEKTVLRDSLPLGAIRLHFLGDEEGKPWNRRFVEEFIEGQFETACLMQTDEIHATGGTVKAAAKVLGKRGMPRAELEALLERSAVDGPPLELKPTRREIFLPGLLVLVRLAQRTGAKLVNQVSVSVGAVFLERMLERLGAGGSERKGLVLDQLRITNIRPRL